MTRVLAQIEEQSGGRIKTAINPGEGAFYGPKFEYVLRDAIGRDWQCGTTQVDFNLPERFGAFFVDADGQKKTPVMVHRAICGSMERFTGILIEHFAGHFPLWLAPLQVVVATITGEADPYAREVLRAADAAGLRAEADLRNEKINYKVREHSHAKVPVMLVVGRKEGEERTVSIRRLGSPQSRTLPLDQALAELVAEATFPDLRRAEAVAESVASEGWRSTGSMARRRCRKTERGRGRQPAPPFAFDFGCPEPSPDRRLAPIRMSPILPVRAQAGPDAAPGPRPPCRAASRPERRSWSRPPVRGCRRRPGGR